MYPSLLWNTIAFLVNIRVCAPQYHSPHTEGADSSTNKAVLLEQVLLSRDFLLSEQEVHSSTTPGCTPQQHSPTAPQPNPIAEEQSRSRGWEETHRGAEAGLIEICPWDHIFLPWCHTMEMMSAIRLLSKGLTVKHGC